ncbi:8132_t:CDS:2 [Funneliformis mosseae]|uniref:8132_t:CDS:1 n=1 Tax=Funneliformis mosseae TaxID=27381 RepID=A0A9N8VS39_FUNMO|nr:8132_t:CDS:2 [Funneliformis mosseae]
MATSLPPELGDFNRKVAITIKNLSPQVTLEYPVVYIESETLNYGLPMNQLTSDKDRNESLAFMWSVPFNYGF